MERQRRSGLAELLKLINRDSKLSQELEKQRRANLTASVKRNRNGTTVQMIPSFVAPYLAGSSESKLSCGILEFARRGARRGRFLSCPREA